MTNHSNITTGSSNDIDDRFGLLNTSRNNKSKSILDQSRDDDEDSVSSNSSAAFKRSDKVLKEVTTNKNTNKTNSNNDKSIEDILGIDCLEPTRKTDDFFNFSKIDDKQKGQSSLSDLPPLNNSNNFQNSKLKLILNSYNGTQRKLLSLCLKNGDKKMNELRYVLGFGMQM